MSSVPSVPAPPVNEPSVTPTIVRPPLSAATSMAMSWLPVPNWRVQRTLPVRS